VTEKHNVFKDAGAARANLADLLQVDSLSKVTLTRVDRFIVNDLTEDPASPKRACEFLDGPYYVVSAIV